MSEELKEITRLCGVIKEKDKEIERLNKRIDDLNIINEEHRILNGMIRKELQQKENIIKEVREHIETIVKNTPSSMRKDYANMLLIDYKKLLEILDKGE